MKSPAIDRAHVYTDMAGLQKLKSPHMEREEAVRGVAKQFESMMINLMMKTMRQANEVFAEGNMFQDNATKMYRDMLDSQLSLSMTQDRGIGLADMLVKQLMARENGGGRVALYDSIDAYPRSQGVMSRLPSQEASQNQQPGLDHLEGLDKEASLSAEQSLSAEESQTLDQVAYYAEQLSGDVDTQSAEAVPARFDSPEAFIRTLMPAAEQVAQQLGVDAKVLLAQSALETGWGKHMISTEGSPSYNLFGIKADQRWQGPVAEVTTTEYRDGVPVKEKAAFRAYDGYEESFRDYLRFLQENPRYESALAAAEDAERYTHELQQAGYATDPLYAEKINRIMRSSWFEPMQSPVTTGESVSPTAVNPIRQPDNDRG